MTIRPLLLIITCILFVLSDTIHAGEYDITPKEVPSYTSTGKVITVLPVIATKQKAHVAAFRSMPTTDNYREAIINALKASGLFTEVRTSGESDYVLSVNVLEHSIYGSVNNVGLFLIRYQLTDSKTTDNIYADNLFSYSMLSAKDEFVGHTRGNKIIELGVRDNFAQLVTTLGKILTGTNTIHIHKKPVRKKIEKQPVPEEYATYPHKLTGDEIREHFQRYKSISMKRKKGLRFTLKIISKEDVERECDLCTTENAYGTITFKESQDQVCFYWVRVSYPADGCFYVIQVDVDRYQLVKTVGGETYIYKVP